MSVGYFGIDRFTECVVNDDWDRLFIIVFSSTVSIRMLDGTCDDASFIWWSRALFDDAFL